MADVLVCRDGEMKDNTVRIIKTGNLEIGVIRHEGKYFAYRNFCPHMGGPACEGIRMPAIEEVIAEDKTWVGQRFIMEDMHIVCPWHGYEFHLETGVNACDKALRLQKFNVTEKNGEVFVSV